MFNILILEKKTYITLLFKLGLNQGNQMLLDEYMVFKYIQKLYYKN